MIKIQWLASIGNVKTIETKLNYKSDQNPMTSIDLTSKRSKCWVKSQNIQNKGKLQKWSKSNDLHRFDVKTIKTKQITKPIKLQLIASIGCQNIQNKAKLQKWSKSNDLHRFDVKTIKNVELRRKTFKTKLNYKSDQNPMTCIDLMSKHSKQSKTIKPIKLQWIASITSSKHSKQS